MSSLLQDIDLIITTKNRVNDLLFTLDYNLSIIGFEQSQIHIVDDASTDGTFETVKAKFPQINIVHNDESQGLIVNRNRLMRNTTRKFIFSLDDDSHVRTRDDIEEALSLLDTDKTYGCFCFKPFEQIEQPPGKEELTADVIRVKSYIGCGHIIKRSVFEAVGEYREELEFYCEETDFCIRAYQLGYVTVLQKNLVVHHRIDWQKRAEQTQSDLSKGIYGAVWRSQLGFSNHLYMDYLYFPLWLRFYLLTKHIVSRFYFFVLKKGDYKGFFGGLKRFLYLINKSSSNARNRLPYDSAKSYLNLNNF